MLSVTFDQDGTITVHAYKDGTSVRVSAPVNQLQALLPAATFEAVRERMAAFLDVTAQAPRLHAVR